MKHIFLKFLIVGLMLSIAPTSLTMEIIPEKPVNPSKGIKLCLEGVRQHNIYKVNKGLSLGADVNGTNSDGKSLFYLAREKPKKNKAITKMLVSHEKIDINSCDKNGFTPLHIACSLGLTTAVESMLLKTPQAAKLYNKQGSTPLHVATVSGKVDCIKLLLPHSTINEQSYQGKTALYQASFCSQFEACKLLIENGANINQQNYDGNTPLHMARTLDIIKLFVKKGANTTIQNNNRETPLFSIFYTNDPDSPNNFFDLEEDIIDQLIEATDENKNTQLHLCATIPTEETNFYYEHQDYLHFLIARGINTTAKNNDGKTAMELACEAAEELNKQYQAEQLPYIQIALQSQLNTIKNLIQMISGPKKIDNSAASTICEDTPLITAVQIGNINYIRRVLEAYDPNINYQDNRGNTALHYACNFIRSSDIREVNIKITYELIKLLLEKGALPTIKNNNQETPLVCLFLANEMFLSFFKQYPDLVNQFILTTDEQKNNQFHLCTQQSLATHSEHYLSCLKSHDLDINTRNNSGKRASDLACEAYDKVYNHYIASKKLLSIKQALDDQEMITHAFLRFTSPYIKYMLFALQKITAEMELPPELKLYITHFVYGVNLETIVAKKYKHNSEYYDDYIENKNKIRQQLLTKPELQLLWNK